MKRYTESEWKKKGQKARRSRAGKILKHEPKPPVITPTHYIHEYARVHDKSDTWLTNALADVARGGKLNENTGKIETKEQIDKKVAREKKKVETAKIRAAAGKYRKRQKANKEIEAIKLRQGTIDEIKKINPFFDDPDNILDQKALEKRLDAYKVRSNDLDTIRSVNPDAWEAHLRSGQMPRTDTLRSQADFYLRGGAGDPNANISQRKGPAGILETELPAQLNQAEIDSTLGISGSDVRPTIEIERTGSNPQVHAKQWNGLVEDAAAKLDADGYFEPGYSDVRRPKNYKGDGTGSKFLSNKELWVAERSLEYGHLGSASQPGFFYVVNYDGNGHPEFALWNRQTDAGMTPTEYDIAGKRISSGRGFEWDKVNRGRFDGYLDEMLGILDNEGFDNLSQTLGYFENLEESPWHLDDPQRDYVSKTTIHDRPNLDPDSSYLLTNDQNNLTLDNFTRREDLEVRRAAIAARIGFMKSIPQVDLNAALGGAKGLISPTGEDKLGLKVSDEANKVAQLTDEQLALLRKYGLEVMAEGENLTVDQVLRRAVARMPKAPVALIALTASMGKAFADAPADEETLMTALRGLQNYDTDIVSPGKETIMSVADALGIGNAMRNVDDKAGGDLDQSKGASGHVARFIYDAVKDTPAELVGAVQGLWNGFIGNTGSAAQGSVPEGTPYHDFGEDALPENVMELYQEATPWKKYGGVLQNRYP